MAVLMLLTHVAGAAPAVHADHPRIGTHAQAAALIDVESGRILYSHNGDKPMLIASLTKVMTAIVAIEHGNLEDEVTVGRNAVGKEGSSIYLKLGEKMSLENLLYGLMLRSGNDAATAIAEHVGGSIEGFAFLMNQKAEEIGMTNSHFVNPHGLDAKDHYASANDMAKLTAYALRNKSFRQIVSTKVKKAPNPHEDWDYVWHNKNKMLRFYDGADGVKTGYTKAAGRCLISSATQGGRQLAVVTLNDGNDWLDHRHVLDWGFQYFPHRTLIKRGSAIQGTGLRAAADFSYPLVEEERSELSSSVETLDEKSLDYRLGKRGELVIKLRGEVIGRVPLLAADDPVWQEEKQVAASAGMSSGAGSYQQTLTALVRALFTGETR
ncbi:D-alanyl-D-alanine carboxypeptidase [Xylanibacillus composti]|nr:D-alanyl-D-alanine carboxypeptidase [Xylanibacillus composti]